MGAEDFKVGGIQANMDTYNSGFDGADVSSLQKTTLPQFSQLTVNFAKGHDVSNNTGYNPQELIANFDAKFGNRVGLGQNIFSPQQGQNLHLIT